MKPNYRKLYLSMVPAIVNIPIAIHWRSVRGLKYKLTMTELPKETDIL